MIIVEYLIDVLLPVLLYTFGIILLIVLIILGIRMIKILDKLDMVVDDVANKVSTLDGLFNAIERATDGINSITSKVSYTMVNMFSKIFRKRKKNKEEY
ncbi:MAG: hypothetical protein J6B89_05110 [Bacilli bacterium]|nr:hypothetical protein [Bacilli bacterium]